METQRRVQLVVGGFLFMGLIVIMVTIFLLGGDKALFTKFVRLHAHFDSVQGLSKGSVVSLSGIPIGNIEEIGFAEDPKFLDVTMKVEEQYISKIPEGSQVEIRTQGALGDKFIYIIPSLTPASSVKEGAKLEVAKATDILGIIGERGKETARIFDVINDLYKMTQAITADRKLEKIMTNLSSATDSLNQTADSARKLTNSLAQGNPDQKLNRSLDKFEGILNKIDKGQGTLGALINDPALHDRLKAMLGANSRKSHVKDLLRTSIEKSQDGK